MPPTPSPRRSRSRPPGVVGRRARASALGLALALAALSTLPAACKRAEEQPLIGVVVAALPALDARHEPLRARFDGEADAPRVLVLASPT